METGFQTLLEAWPSSVRILTGDRPTLLVSKSGLSETQLAALREDLVQACGPDTLSCILSIKMMHIYFRWGSKTYDYRPHRGMFSKLVTADYRIANTDRAEAVIRLGTEELKRFRTYIANIEKSPREVLGDAHALQIGEPDFTVLATETEGELNRNRFLESGVKHNCLTWLTTAPLGPGGEPLWKRIGMGSQELGSESHSYIVPFYQYLAGQASPDRVPAIVLWTESDIESAAQKFSAQPGLIRRFYAKEETALEST